MKAMSAIQAQPGTDRSTKFDFDDSARTKTCDRAPANGFNFG